MCNTSRELQLAQNELVCSFHKILFLGHSSYARDLSAVVELCYTSNSLNRQACLFTASANETALTNMGVLISWEERCLNLIDLSH